LANCAGGGSRGTTIDGDSTVPGAGEP